MLGYRRILSMVTVVATNSMQPIGDAEVLQTEPLIWHLTSTPRDFRCRSRRAYTDVTRLSARALLRDGGIRVLSSWYSLFNILPAYQRSSSPP